MDCRKKMILQRLLRNEMERLQKQWLFVNSRHTESGTLLKHIETEIALCDEIANDLNDKKSHCYQQ